MANFKCHVLGKNRTLNPQIRSLMLYPIKLQAHFHTQKPQRSQELFVDSLMRLGERDPERGRSPNNLRLILRQKFFKVQEHSGAEVPEPKAEKGTRTLNLSLGKATLDQLSYFRTIYKPDGMK